ncbi:hypothetical protein NHH03_09800 [Stieleria sp. TO1_6]|uniref:hypothetical protein n=1 Tax=Stieleria tagensis TaxID=2956795 RepID=UPI00209A839E|nr:hypothetical protein [Stieleria tagensis]MCO8122030.1 hypothetical protein [Stieleria tagensis]
MNDQPVATPKRRGLRFSLLELMVVTGIVAVWLPTFFAAREIPSLENQVQQMRALTSDLSIIDENEWSIRTLPGIWHNIHGWKYYLPAGAEMELRLATEGINSQGDPEEFQSVDVPSGIHTVHLKNTRSHDREYITEVFLDDKQVLRQIHPEQWLESSGSTSSGSPVESTSEAFPLDKPVCLRQMRLIESNPQTRFRSFNSPQEYDAKGNLLCLVPRGYVSRPAPRFVTPKNGAFRNTWGNRQGTRLVVGITNQLNGLLGIQPDARAIMDDGWNRWGKVLNAISVRPLLDDSRSVKPSTNNMSADSPVTKIPTLTVTNSLQPDARDSGNLASGVISENGKVMRVFVHYSSLPSGALIAVEVIFDSDHPDRIGFLPHQIQGSPPIKACQFETRFDSRFQWRRIDLLPVNQDGSVAESESQLVPQVTTLQKLAAQEKSPNGWQAIPAEQMPTAPDTIDEDALSELKLTTDVADFSQVTYPAGTRGQWDYKGLPVGQKWLLPRRGAQVTDGQSVDDAIQAEIQTATVYPGTQAAIPGGAVISNVRVTVPMPADRPIWLEIQRQ